MLARVAVLPHPPLLIPRVTTGGAVETRPLRQACLNAAAAVRDAARVWFAVGRTDPDRDVETADAGTLRGYGVDLAVALGPESGPVVDGLALPFLVAAWLRGQVGPGNVLVHPRPIAAGATGAECASAGQALAATLAERTEPVSLLVLGDGAATHSLRAPGYFDRRAAGFDAAVADALAGPDLTALLELDGDLAAALGVAGREAWQVGAAAAAASAPAWRGELLFSQIPYGVAYHVAVWDPVR